MTELDFDRLLLAPLEDLLKRIAQGVAEAQTQLDSSALKLQERISSEDQYKQLRDLGYAPNWYAIQAVDAELKMVVHYAEDEKTPGKPKAFWSFFNGQYRTNLTFSEQGASSLKVTIAPVPPPSGATGTQPTE